MNSDDKADQQSDGEQGQWLPHGTFMIRIGDEHFMAVDRTGNRWRDYPRDYTTTLRDAIIRDHTTAAQVQATNDKYIRLVEHMTTILRAVRHSEGEQLSHEEIATRVVSLASQVQGLLAALREEAEFCEAQAETPSDEGLTLLQNQIFEDIHLAIAGRLRAAIAQAEATQQETA